MFRSWHSDLPILNVRYPIVSADRAISRRPSVRSPLFDARSEGAMLRDNPPRRHGENSHGVLPGRADGGDPCNPERVADAQGMAHVLCIVIHIDSGMERDSRKLIRHLERDGWIRVAAKGSHLQFKHPNRQGRVTVPHPNRNLKRGTVASIYRQAGWKSSGG